MIPKAIPMQVRHILLLLIVFILYVIFGGLIFMLLESPQEQIKRAEVEAILVDLKEQVRSLNHTFLTESYIRGTINRLLEAKETNLIDKHGNQSLHINWSFMNSFFFAITVITTIGYGHLTPSTLFGKIFCIGYALFGIPITGLLIGSLADRFSKLYSSKEPPRKSYGKVYNRQLSDQFRMLKRAAISLVPWFFVFLIIPAIIFTCIEEWSFLDGFYYCFVTLSTIGFGDFVAGGFEHDYVWVYKIVVVFWIIFGLAYLSMILNFISQSLRSRHISNVMHSLRYRLSMNPNLKGHRHPSHFKRQQSTPVVLFPQSKTNKKMFHEHHMQHNNRTDISVNADIESGQKPQKLGFWNSLFKHFKQSSKTNKSSQQTNQQQSQTQQSLAEQRKSSIRCAYDDKSSMRHTNSLPDLAPAHGYVDGTLEISNIEVFMAECIEPTCSMCEYDHNSVTKMSMV